MSKPLQKAGDFAERIIHPVMEATQRALTIPGLQPAQPSSGPTINMPDPASSTPAKIPGSKPSGRNLQQSFLSGVAGGAAGQGLSGGSWDWRGGSSSGTGSSSGKSLIGA